MAAIAARGGGARSSQPTPLGPAANQQRPGRRNDLTGSTLLPLPHGVVGAGSRSREVWARGMGEELVMSPFPYAIGCRVAGLRPIGSLRKSGAAPRKALLPPEGRGARETGRGPAVVGRRALRGRRHAWSGAAGPGPLRDLDLRTARSSESTLPSLNLGRGAGRGRRGCGASWGFTLPSVGERTAL